MVCINRPVRQKVGRGPISMYNNRYVEIYITIGPHLVQDMFTL